MTRRLRVGVIGLGFGAAVHVPGLRGVEGVEVVGLAGTDAGRARDLADRLEIPLGCGAIGELLDLSPDAVTVAVPPDRNAAVVSAALERGVPVLSEKPLTQDATRARALARQAAGITTAVDFEFLELGVFLTLKRAVEGARYGALRSARVTWETCSRAHEARRWSWKVDAERGGGVLPLLGSHVLFMVESLFGRVTSVASRLDAAATAAWAPDGARAAPDSAELELLHASGTETRVRLSSAASLPGAHRWEASFEKARLVAHNPTRDPVMGFTLVAHEPGAGDRLLADEGAGAGADGRIAPFRALASRFAAAVRQAQPCAPDFEAGARVQELLDAAETAARLGSAVAV